eukprot:TRINITY_DN5989_c0_g1_i2.p2 TRINITY_DN5989_c0_g1~~TRINITY_DN5989_c0_g1_i2.p2  ORF type:complete len:101 (-),score=9.45 TRINITY_DN5989_c0_g1_i2:240-542(-)
MGNASASTATESTGKSYHTKCFCVGCGCSEFLCAPLVAGDVRCCCVVANVKVDPSLCKETRDMCIARAGVRVGPLVVDATNPLIDKHELVVVADKQLIGC